MTDGEDEVFDVPGSLVSRLLPGARGPCSAATDELCRAQARLTVAQARLAEVEAARAEAELRAARPRSLVDVLPGRFDLLVVGARGSGKTRAVTQLAARFEAAGVRVVRSVARWPDWRDARHALVVVDEAGLLMESRDGEVPTGLRTAVAAARHLEVSTVLVAQTTSQVPPALLRHGFGMLVTGAPWLWRVFARAEMQDRLNAAHACIIAARAIDPASIAYVDPDGVAQAVLVNAPEGLVRGGCQLTA